MTQVYSRTTTGSLLLALSVMTLGALRVVNPADAGMSGESAQGLLAAQVGGLRSPGAPNRPTIPLETAAPLLESERVYPLTLLTTTIGRSLDNAISLPDPSISREHALLTLHDSGWRIENISERNPFWAAGQVVSPGESADVQPGDILRLGYTCLQLLAPRARYAYHTPPVTPARVERLPDALASETLASDDDASDDSELVAPAPTATPPISQTRRVEQTSGGWNGIPADAMSTNPLSPSVTLQFALMGRLSRSAWWALALIAAVVFVASGIITLDLASLAGRVALANGGLEQALTALSIPLAPALGVALLVGALDRYEREPLLTMLGAFLWGAIIAIPPTLYIERGLNGALLGFLGAHGVALGLARAATQAGVAGVTEELVKGAGLLLLMLVLRDEFDNVTDGVIYGALVGAGFAMVENFVYFAVSPRSDLGVLIVGRIALGWLSHSTFSALFGAGLGYIRETRDRRARWLAPIGGMIGAIILHAYFDFIALSVEVTQETHSGPLMTLARFGDWLPVASTLADYLPLLLTELALLTIVLAALRREAAVVRAYLAVEVLSGVVTPDEYLFVQNARLRSLVERRYGLSYGPRVYLLARALFQMETGLAFRKWHVEMGDPPKRGDRQPEDVYRRRITRIRRTLAAAVMERHDARAAQAAQQAQEAH
ncbi:MAG TPA: PrsW family glutamic-type intramembrane protease [Ktedonobacterales bacterium]|nr:PrsW family glutamic-type intramembrane protease [Ktedonobacterales bacterium]